MNKLTGILLLSSFPLLAQIDLQNQVKGNLGVNHLNSGINADSSHAWFGDGTWKLVNGSSAGFILTDTSGSTTAYSGNTASPALVAGNQFTMILQNQNSVTNPTVNFGSGAKTIKNSYGTALAINQLPANTPILAVYDGTAVLIYNCPFQVGGAGLLSINCAVQPATVDGNTSALPVLTTTNDFTGKNIFELGYLQFKAVTAPTTPPSGYGDIYFSSVDKLPHALDDSGTDTALGASRAKLLFSHINTSPVTCNGSAQTVDTVTIPANTFQVGDHFWTRMMYTKAGATSTSAVGIIFGGAALAPCCTSTTSANGSQLYIDAQYDVAGASSEIPSGMAYPANNTTVFYPQGGGNGTSAISGSITITVQQTCSASDTGSITWTGGLIR